MTYDDEEMPQPPAELPPGWQPGDMLPPEEDGDGDTQSWRSAYGAAESNDRDWPTGGLLARADPEGRLAPQEQPQDRQQPERNGPAPVGERAIGANADAAPGPLGTSEQSDKPVGREALPPYDPNPRPVDLGQPETTWGGKPIDRDPTAEAHFLPEHVKDILGKYFSAGLLDKIRIHTGLPPIAKLGIENKQAITLGNDVYILPGKYDPTTIEGLQLMAHEITHSQQVAAERFGLPGFAAKYLGGYVVDRALGKDQDASYTDLGYEQAASKNAEAIAKNLKDRFGDTNVLYPEVGSRSGGNSEQ
jgi:hypothetical protein